MSDFSPQQLLLLLPDAIKTGTSNTQVDQMQVHLLSSSFDVFGIIKTVTSSIAEVFFLCLVGYILSRNGVIDSKSKNTLNKINVSFFTPALMFSKVAFSLSYSKLADLYIVPISFVIITFVSYLAGYGMACLLRLGGPERNFVLSFSMFMNSNSLPIALMTSLVSSLHGGNGLDWGVNDSKDKQLGRSLSYLVVFSTLGLILRWSYGVGLLSASVGTDGDDRSSISSCAQRNDSREEESVGLLQSPSNPIESPTVPTVEVIDVSTTDHSSPQQPPTSPISQRAPASPQSVVSFPVPGGGPSESKTHNLTHKPASNQIPLAKPEKSLHSLYRSDSEENDEVSDDESTISTSTAHADRHHKSPPHRVMSKRRPIFHSFPNLRMYWHQSIRSTASSRASIFDPVSEDDRLLRSVDSHADITERLPAEGCVRDRKDASWVSRVARWLSKLWRRVVVRPVLRVNQFMTPPLYAALLSLVVVCLPKLQRWLEGIHPLRSALKSAGQVSVPLTLVVLGAYFNTQDTSKKAEQVSDPSIRPYDAGQKIGRRDKQETRMARRTIFGSIIARQILTPMILIPVLFLILRAVGTRRVRSPSSGEMGRTYQARFHEDPCFVLVMVLLIGAPSAITLAQMTSANPFVKGTRAYEKQAAQNIKFEKLVSRALFFEYAIVTPPMTVILVVCGLWVVEATR